MLYFTETKMLTQNTLMVLTVINISIHFSTTRSMQVYMMIIIGNHTMKDEIMAVIRGRWAYLHFIPENFQ